MDGSIRTTARIGFDGEKALGIVGFALGLVVSVVALALVAPAVAADSTAHSGPYFTDETHAGSGPALTGENGTQLYGGAPVEHVQSIKDLVRTPDGGMIAIQQDLNTSAGTAESTVLRVDANGEVTSRETVTGQLEEIERVGLESYAAVGPEIPHDNNALMVWIDESGTIEWTETYGGDGLEIPTDVASAPDGDAYLLASSESFGVNTSDLWVLRIDSSGEVAWNRLVEHEKWTAFPEGVELADGSLIATIRTERSMDKEIDGQQNVSVARIMPDGSIAWRTVVASNERPNDKEEMFDVVPAHGDGVLITGASNSGSPPADRNFDFWATRLDSEGEVLWQREYDVPNREFSARTVRTANGYVLTGFADRGDAPGVGKLLVIDRDGNERFTTTFAHLPRFTNRIHAIDWMTDGRLVIGGLTANEDENDPRSAAWIYDVSDAVSELEPAPSVWQTQNVDASASEVDTPTETVAPPIGGSSSYLVLSVATALSVVALFVPYGVRRLRRR